MNNISESVAEKVSVDYFLYSCFEYENTSRSWPTNSELRWPEGLQLAKNTIPESVSEKSLEQVFEELCAWYLEKTPVLNQDLPIDSEVLADIVPAFTSITHDIDQVVKAKTGDYLPTYDSGAECEVWSAVNSVVAKIFPYQKEMYLRFLHWSHASQPQELPIDPGSRPPVGRFVPYQQRGRGDRHSNSGGRGISKGGPDGNRRQQGRSSDRRGHQQNSRRPKVDSGSSSPKRQHNPKLERDSLKEVLLAVQKLNEDSSLTEYRLRPINSYYRRLQHKQIKQEGLFSKSVGSGEERSVVVLRSKGRGDSASEEE